MREEKSTSTSKTSRSNGRMRDISADYRPVQEQHCRATRREQAITRQLEKNPCHTARHRPPQHAKQLNIRGERQRRTAPWHRQLTTGERGAAGGWGRRPAVTRVGGWRPRRRVRGRRDQGG